MNKRQENYFQTVKQLLEAKLIEVEYKEIELFNLLNVMKNVAETIVNERKKGNTVLINMSTGGTMTAVGATLAG